MFLHYKLNQKKSTMSKMNEDQTIEQIIAELPDDRKQPVKKIRELLHENLPEGFEETISYRMIAFVVPHSVYPQGYYVNPNEPLPFISIASQKNHIALYHMGLYTDDDLLEWYQKKYAAIVGKKPDMGKSCLRFKKTNDIPYDLLKELFQKITPQDWVKTYEQKVKRD